MKKSLLAVLLCAMACSNGEAQDKDKPDKNPDSSRSVNSGKEPGWERIALYVGINKYTHPSLKSKSLHGCVNDMHNLRAVLESQYQFPRARSKMLDTADTTTWTAIKGGLEWLMAQADKAKAAGVKPTIVIGYAGHGGSIKALDAKTEGTDAKDETWVPSDGNNKGARDIRDDDLGKVVQYLCDQGATVVRFNDSCHSGTGYRGDELAMTRSAHEASSLFDIRPPEMFAGLKLLDPNKARLAYFAACQDEQKAKEGKDDNKQPCGRFTYSLVRALKEASGATYEALAVEASRMMDTTWDGEIQRPNFRGFGDVDTQSTFGVPPLPPHVRILKGSQTGRFVEIEAGSAQGVRKGQRIDLYGSLGHLRRGEQLDGGAMFGTVRTVNLGTSKLALERSEDLPKTTVATLGDSIRLPDFTINVRGDMPLRVQKVLAKLEKEKTIEQATKGFSMQLRWKKDSDRPHLRLYWADRLWDEGAKEDPFVLEYVYDDPEADPIDNVLTKLALRQRMLRMRRNEKFLTLTAELDKEKALGKAIHADGAPPRWETTLYEEYDVRRAAVQFKVKSSYHKKLWVFLFMFEEYEYEVDGEVRRIYAASPLHPGDDTLEANYTVEPNGELTIPKLLYPGPKERKEMKGSSRVKLKLLATDKKYSPTRFKHICAPLNAGSRGDDEAEDELLIMMEGLGTSSSRGSEDLPAVTFWATKSAAFELVERGAK